jgi:cation transport ATPase
MENKKDNLDFDDLKGLWQSSLESDAANDPIFNHLKILTIMQEKTSAAVQKIRRNLMIEVLTTIPVLIGAYFFLESRGVHLPIFLWIGIVFITIGYQVYLYWKLQKEAVPMASVSENINTQHANLQHFMKMYKVGAILGGIVFCAASGRFFYDYYSKDGLIFPILMLLSLSSGYGFYAFTHWYTQKLYGQYFSTLEASRKVLAQN